MQYAAAYSDGMDDHSLWVTASLHSLCFHFFKELINELCSFLVDATQYRLCIDQLFTTDARRHSIKLVFTVPYLVFGTGPASLPRNFMSFGVVADRFLGCPSLFETFLKQILFTIRLIDSDFDRYRGGRLALFCLNV